MTSSDYAAIRGVYFDAGGTLLYPYPSVGEIYAAVLRRWGVDMPARELEEAFRATWKSMTHEARNFITEENEKAWWKKLVRRTLHGRQLPADFDGFFDDLYLTFASADHWRVFDGALDCLRCLRRAGYRVGVLSNWDHRLRCILEGLPLLAELDEVVISSEVGFEKPDPRIFAEAARRWDLVPGQLLCVGDSYYHDIEPSLKLGWSALLIHRHEPHPDAPSVRHFSEIPALLGI